VVLEVECLAEEREEGSSLSGEDLFVFALVLGSVKLMDQLAEIRI
jgi:hypothetical protein